MNNRIVLRGLTVLVSALTLQMSSTAAVDDTPAAIIGPEVMAHGTGVHVASYFNPKEYSITKSTPWKHHDIQGLDAPTLEFTSGEPSVWQFELFFDRYEEGKSIREITDKIEKLALADPRTGRPPMVRVMWAKKEWAGRIRAARTQVVKLHRDGTPAASRVTLVMGGPFGVDHSPPPRRKGAFGVRVQFANDIASATVDTDGAAFVAGPGKDGFATAYPLDDASLRDFAKRGRIAPGSPDRLTLPLFFDTSASGNDVSDLIQDMLDAMGPPDADGNRQPVLAELAGRVFRGRVAAVEIRYTLFLDDGTPVRARMNTVWKEFSPAEEQLKGNPRH